MIWLVVFVVVFLVSVAAVYFDPLIPRTKADLRYAFSWVLEPLSERWQSIGSTIKATLFIWALGLILSVCFDSLLQGLFYLGLTLAWVCVSLIIVIVDAFFGQSDEDDCI